MSVVLFSQLSTYAFVNIMFMGIKTKPRMNAHGHAGKIGCWRKRLRNCQKYPRGSSVLSVFRGEGGLRLSFVATEFAVLVVPRELSEVLTLDALFVGR